MAAPLSSTRRRNPVGAAREAAEHALRVARLELELQLLEGRRRATTGGIGAGFGLVALLLFPLVVAFLLAAVAAALATTVQVWLAILIVGASLGGLVLVFAVTAVVLVRRAVHGRGEDRG